MEKILKILIIGPSGCGKTCVANYQAEKTDPIEKVYKPTIGARILEFEKTVCHMRCPTGEKWTCQLWDLSGDSRFEKCWPAVTTNTNGIMIFYNGDIKLNDEEFLGWIKVFPHKLNIAPNYCLGFAHHPSGQHDNFEIKNFTKFGLSINHTSIEDGLNTIVPIFDRFIMQLVEKFYNDLEEAIEEGEEED